MRHFKMRERGVKKNASFKKNEKMSVVPINNLGFSVRQLWRVLWIPPMGPSLLPAVDLPSSEICICECACFPCVSAAAEAPQGQQCNHCPQCHVWDEAGDAVQPNTQSTQSDCHPCTRIHMWQMWWWQID